MAVSNSNQLRISSYKRENARLVKLIKQAATQEPRSGRHAWQNGQRQMDTVVTFKQSGRSTGSLERFVKANKIPKKVYNRLRAAVAAGAHRQSASGGLVKFKVTDASLKKLQKQLDDMAIRRDKDDNGKLEGRELKSFQKLDNGKAATARGASAALKATKLRGNRTELKYSKQVSYAMDLLYSNGNIRGRDHVEQIASGLNRTEAEAVRAAYAAVSRYISRGRTGSLRHICRDQRREVQRGLMRTFGGSLDRTEKAISKLRIPRGR